MSNVRSAIDALTEKRPKRASVVHPHRAFVESPAAIERPSTPRVVVYDAEFEPASNLPARAAVKLLPAPAPTTLAALRAAVHRDHAAMFRVQAARYRAFLAQPGLDAPTQRAAFDQVGLFERWATHHDDSAWMAEAT